MRDCLCCASALLWRQWDNSCVEDIYMKPGSYSQTQDGIYLSAVASLASAFRRRNIDSSPRNISPHDAMRGIKHAKKAPTRSMISPPIPMPGMPACLPSALTLPYQWRMYLEQQHGMPWFVFLPLSHAPRRRPRSAPERREFDSESDAGIVNGASYVTVTRKGGVSNFSIFSWQTSHEYDGLHP